MASGLMFGALSCGLNDLVSSRSEGHCVLFLGKTLNSQSASLYPGVSMGTGEFNIIVVPYQAAAV